MEQTDLQRRAAEALANSAALQAESELSKKIETAKAQSERNRTERRTAHQKREDELQAAHLARLDVMVKAEALKAYTAAGGDAASFDKEWPAIKAEGLRQRAAATVAIVEKQSRIKLWF